MPSPDPLEARLDAAAGPQPAATPAFESLQRRVRQRSRRRRLLAGVTSLALLSGVAVVVRADVATRDDPSVVAADPPVSEQLAPQEFAADLAVPLTSLGDELLREAVLTVAGELALTHEGLPATLAADLEAQREVTDEAMAEVRAVLAERELDDAAPWWPVAVLDDVAIYAIGEPVVAAPAVMDRDSAPAAALLRSLERVEQARDGTEDVEPARHADSYLVAADEATKLVLALDAATGHVPVVAADLFLVRRYVRVRAQVAIEALAAPDPRPADWYETSTLRTAELDQLDARAAIDTAASSDAKVLLRNVSSSVEIDAAIHQIVQGGSVDAEEDRGAVLVLTLGELASLRRVSSRLAEDRATRSADIIGAATQEGRVQRVLQNASLLSTLNRHVAVESLLSVAHMLDDGDSVFASELAEARAATDEAAADVRRMVERTEDASESYASRMESLLIRLDGLDVARASIDELQVEPFVVAVNFEQTQTAAVELLWETDLQAGTVHLDVLLAIDLASAQSSLAHRATTILLLADPQTRSEHLGRLEGGMYGIRHYGYLVLDVVKQPGFERAARETAELLDLVAGGSSATDLPDSDTLVEQLLEHLETAHEAVLAELAE